MRTHGGHKNGAASYTRGKRWRRRNIKSVMNQPNCIFECCLAFSHISTFSQQTPSPEEKKKTNFEAFISLMAFTLLISTFQLPCWADYFYLNSIREMTDNWKYSSLVHTHIRIKTPFFFGNGRWYEYEQRIVVSWLPRIYMTYISHKYFYERDTSVDSARPFNVCQRGIRYFSMSKYQLRHRISYSFDEEALSLSVQHKLVLIWAIM